MQNILNKWVTPPMRLFQKSVYQLPDGSQGKQGGGNVRMRKNQRSGF